MAVRPDQLVYRAGGAALARFGTLRKRTAGFEEVVETWARASTAAEFDRNGVLRLCQSGAVRVSFVDLDGDDVRETLAVPMEGALTQLVEHAIPGGSEADFELVQLDGVTNLAAEFAPRIEVGDDLRYAVPANFDPNNFTISGWVIPDWASGDGKDHIIADMMITGNNRVQLYKGTNGKLYCYVAAAGVAVVASLTKTLVAGTPFFLATRLNGGTLTLYADTNADGTLDTNAAAGVGTLAAGSYNVFMGQSASSPATLALEGAVNLLITDNGGSANPITDRFNAGAGLALYGDDCWLARHGKNLVLHVGGNAAGTAIQAETYSGATDMLAGTATGRVDLPPTTGYVRFGNTAEFDGATKVSMMWEVEVDATGEYQCLFASDGVAGPIGAGCSLGVVLHQGGGVLACFDSGSNWEKQQFAVTKAAGDHFLLGMAVDLGLATRARVKWYQAIYDPITKRYGAWAELTGTKSGGGTIPATITAEAGLHQIGGGTWDGKIDDFRWKVGEAHDFTAIKPTVNEPDPGHWAHAYAFDGDGVDLIGGLTATVTGGSYVDDGRHGKGSMERWTKAGQYAFPVATNKITTADPGAGADGITQCTWELYFTATAPG